MKRLVALAVICHLLLASLSITVAEADIKNVDVFTQAQFASSQKTVGLNARQIVMLGDTLYAYLDNASVYSWRISEPTPHSFCQLPELPEPTLTAYRNLESEAKAQWDKTVSLRSSARYRG